VYNEIEVINVASNFFKTIHSDPHTNQSNTGINTHPQSIS